MDLTSPAWTQSPLRARPAQLPGSAQLVAGRPGGSPHLVARHDQLGMGGSAGTSDIRGDADGADVMLPCGIVMRRRRVGFARVSDGEMLEAIRGVLQLPTADQQRIARSGVPIELLPIASLGVGNLGGPILGSTSIEGSYGGWQPTLVRVVVHSPHSTSGNARETIGEIVQHELGHVNAVLTGQDRSEQAAERYALTH